MGGARDGWSHNFEGGELSLLTKQDEGDGDDHGDSDGIDRMLKYVIYISGQHIPSLSPFLLVQGTPR